MCEQVNYLKVRMSRHFLPLLLGGFILQLQCLSGHAQNFEPYQSQAGVSTSFVNTPVSSINPYSQFSTGVQTVDQNTYIQPYSSGLSSSLSSGLNPGLSSGLSSGMGSSFSSGINPGLSSGLSSGTSQISYVQAGQQPQQQVISGGQSSFVRQQSPVYFTVTPEGRSLATSQQISQPNFIYRTRGQLPHTVDTGVLSQNVETSSVPIHREFVYPVEVPQARSSSQFQFPSNVFTQTQQQPQVTSSEKFIPLSNLRPTLSEDSKVITLGDNPFVITSIKPKQPPSVQVVPNKKNPLESLRTEAIIEALLNAGKNDASRSNQIVVTTKSDVGRVPVTEALPQVFTTTPVTEIFTEASPTPTVTIIPTEQVISTTTPIPIPSTSTTTMPPPPPVHVEVTTTEEHHYVSRKKKVTIFIRVEDGGFDAEEKENYSTKQDFHEWTKTIVEPTDIFEEKTTFVKNETREVDGPSLGVDVTKVICRNFVDDKETVVELDALQGNAICPKPMLDDGSSWEEKVYRRIDSEVKRKLRDIFNFPKVGHMISSESSFVSTPYPTVARTLEPVSSGFLRHSLEAIQNLTPKVAERHLDQVPVKRDVPKTELTEKTHSMENEDLVAEASEVALATDSTIHQDSDKMMPYMTSKRETKPEVVEEVKKDTIKTEEVKQDVIKPEEVKKNVIKPEEMKQDVIKAEEVKKDVIKPEEVKKDVIKTIEIQIEGIKREVKPEEAKTEEVKTGVVPTTPESHIMVITKTPPVRPPNPYHHDVTTVLPLVAEVVPNKTEALPAPQALSASVEKVSTTAQKVHSHPEENKDRTFFRRST